MLARKYFINYLNTEKYEDCILACAVRNKKIKTNATYCITLFTSPAKNSKWFFIIKTQ